MNLTKKLLWLLVFTCSGLLGGEAAKAAIVPGVSLSIISGDLVQMSGYGDPNSLVQFSFYQPGSSAVTVLSNFATTDGNGRFTNSIGSGATGLLPGAQGYVTINGQQSSWFSWPNYSSSVVLNQNNVQLSLGQTITLTSSNAVIIKSNSNSAVAKTAINGYQIIINATGYGNTTLNACGVNVGCASINVSVSGGNGQSAIYLSQTNVSLALRQNASVSISGDGANSYYVSSNSNPSVASAVINGSALSLTGGTVAGSTAVVVCGTNTASCATLWISTNGSSSGGNVTFSESAFSLSSQQSHSVLVYGDSVNSYYVASNSNSAVAIPSMSANVLTVRAGVSTGSATIQVCAAVSGNCGSVVVTVNTNQQATTVSLGLSTVHLRSGQNQSISIFGDVNGTYFISNNSDSRVVSSSVSGSLLTLTAGRESGSATVTVCSAMAPDRCANIVATVLVSAPSLSQNTVTLLVGQTTSVVVNDEMNNLGIAANSNTNAVFAVIEGNRVVLNALMSGVAQISVCRNNTSFCSTLQVTVSENQTSPSYTNNYYEREQPAAISHRTTQPAVSVPTPSKQYVPAPQPVYAPASITRYVPAPPAAYFSPATRGAYVPAPAPVITRSAPVYRPAPVVSPVRYTTRGTARFR